MEVVWAKSDMGFGAWGMCVVENCTSLVIYLRKSGSTRIWRPWEVSACPYSKSKACPQGKSKR